MDLLSLLQEHFQLPRLQLLLSPTTLGIFTDLRCDADSIPKLVLVALQEVSSPDFWLTRPPSVLSLFSIYYEGPLSSGCVDELRQGTKRPQQALRLEKMQEAAEVGNTSRKQASQGRRGLSINTLTLLVSNGSHFGIMLKAPSPIQQPLAQFDIFALIRGITQ